MSLIAQDPEKAKLVVMKFLNEWPSLGRDELEIRQRLASLPEWPEFKSFLETLVSDSLIRPKEQKVGQRVATLYLLTQKGQKEAAQEASTKSGTGNQKVVN